MRAKCLVISPIMWIYNDVLSTNTKTTLNEDDNLSTFACKHIGVTCSNDDYELLVKDTSNFMVSTEKNDMVKGTSTTINFHTVMSYLRL